MSKILAALLIAGSMMSQAQAALIVDTGPAVNTGAGWALYDWQYFGGKFSIGSGQTVHAIDGHFSAYLGGNVSFAIHANGGNTPGAVLYAASSAIPDGTSLNWYGVSGLNWDLAAGDYWVSLRPDASIAGAVMASAANPMAQYAQGHGDYQWYDRTPGTMDFIKMGVRIDATPAAAEVAEPGNLALLGLALAGLGLVRRRMR